MNSLVLLASNLHCPSCVSHVQDVLSMIPGIARAADVSLISHTIRVLFNSDIINHQSITNTLVASAFEIRHITLFDSHGTQVEDYDLTSGGPKQGHLWLRAQQKHIESCEACQKNGNQKGAASWVQKNSASSAADSVERPTVINIDDPAEDDTINTYTASVSIEGMTCGVCVGTITRGLQELPFVSNVNVDLLGNSGTVEFRGKNNLDLILKEFDDLGYSATLIELIDPKSNRSAQGERVIDIQIDDMHCIHCPDRVVKALDAVHPFGQTTSNAFKISKSPSLKDPRVQITYRPSLSAGITIRRFISTIKSVDPSLTVYVYHPPTLEERSRLLQHRERLSILWRLVFTGILAIPSFIIGVVYMALVPSDNHTRMWFEEPMWAGNATRIEWALLIVTTPVMFFGADLFHRRALKEIWATWKPKSTTPLLRRFYRFGSMNMLISIGTTVAYFSSLVILILNAASNGREDHSRMSNTYFDVITFLTFFILMGRYLEAYSKAKTGDAIALLSKLRPNDALLVEADGVKKVPVDQLEIDDVVQIPRGHSPPADGIVERDGTFSFDESSLTGESKPVRKLKGDTVFTGTVNVADPVQVKVTKLGGMSMLDQIIEVVRGSQAKRAPIERFADVLTGYFVPVITLIAITTWVIWLGLGISGRLPDAWLDAQQGGWVFWSLEFAIAVFVVACPCGIGLAAPTALFVGGGLAAKQGILVQGGGQAFQETSNLNAIVFDKTGTLTQGQMKVAAYEQLSEAFSRDLIFAISKAMEGISSHPMGQAIATFCASSSEDVSMSDVREIPGHGMTAKFTFGPALEKNSLEAAIGNEKLLDSLNNTEKTHGPTGSINMSGDAKAQPDSTTLYLQRNLYRHQAQGHSVAIVAIRQSTNFQVAAIFALSDPLRPEAPGVVASLRALNLSIHLCTGDNITTAYAIASQLKIPATNVRAGVLPQGKAEYIYELQHPHQGGRKLVAFVGDGLNDTPALAAADTSISLSSGSDIAINASSFILLNLHLGTIRTLIALSKRVFRRVKINFFWAVIYNVTLIPVAAGVFYMIGATNDHGGWRMSPVWAAVAMAGSSVSVVLSSLALKLPEVKWPWRNRENW